MKKAMIFDMDGTLWDSVQNITESWNKVCSRYGHIQVHVTREKLLGLMGKTMDCFARELLPQLPFEEAMMIMDECCADENDYLRENGGILLGDVEDTFRELKKQGWEVCIVSNCQAGYIEAFLEHYRLGNYVSDLECYGNTKEGKAQNLKRLIRRNGYSHYWYVGDTQGDYDACKEAQVPFIWASYGFGSVDEEVPQIGKLEEIICLAEEKLN